MTHDGATDDDDRFAGRWVREQYDRRVVAALLSDAVRLDLPAAVQPLWALRRLANEVAAAEGRLVAKLRRDGVAWADVASALGVTTQAAQQRYRDVAPRVRRREGSHA